MSTGDLKKPRGRPRGNSNENSLSKALDKGLKRASKNRRVRWDIFKRLVARSGHADAYPPQTLANT